MGTPLIDYVRNLWPFSVLRADDLKLSDKLVRRLSLPECTKQFVFAFTEPKTEATVYVLCAQELSERSGIDVEYLIREVNPDSVIAIVNHNTSSHIQKYERAESLGDLIPTSAFGVLARCFIDKSSKDNYEELAGNLFLKEIFGVGFYNQFLVAKRLAEEIGSSFSVIEPPFLELVGDVDGDGVDSSSDTGTMTNKLKTLALQPATLSPLNFSSVVRHSRRFLVTDDRQSKTNKLVNPSLTSSFTNMSSSGSSADAVFDVLEARCNYQPPIFAQSFYPFLASLHDIFAGLPSMSRALASARKLFLHVSEGDNVDTDILSEVYNFQIAIEGLRVAINDDCRLPMNKLGNPTSDNIDLNELSAEEKSHCLVAQALQSHARKFKTVVAVVDVSDLTGLRKFWNTHIPEEFDDFVEELVSPDFNAEITNDGDNKWWLSSKPVVAVGAGASAVLAASSLSKAVPMATVVKVVSMNVPTSLKLFVTQTYKLSTFVLSKILAPSKVMASGFAGSGVKSSSIVKAAASADKIRAVTQGVLMSAEKTSFSATRTAFYEIMRKRRVQPIGFRPLATFGLSVATCAGLLAYEDEIECAAESVPGAPSIASLGRGIRTLQQISPTVRQLCQEKIQIAIESLTYALKNAKSVEDQVN